MRIRYTGSTYKNSQAAFTHAGPTSENPQAKRRRGNAVLPAGRGGAAGGAVPEGQQEGEADV